MKKGRGQTMTHDYKRYGTTILFGALNTATDAVYGLCQQRHRHHEWLKFLRLIVETINAKKQIHIICDNDSTHKHPWVQRWFNLKTAVRQPKRAYIEEFSRSA
jgi:DDE superfamily endonuclease